MAEFSEFLVTIYRRSGVELCREWVVTPIATDENGDLIHRLPCSACLLTYYELRLQCSGVLCNDLIGIELCGGNCPLAGFV